MLTMNRTFALALLAGAALVSPAAQAAYKITTFDLQPGMPSTTVYDVNKSGAFVGSFGDYGGFSDGSTERAFVYRNGITTVLDGPAGATKSFAGGISDEGTIVGYFHDGTLTPEGNERRRGFIHANGAYASFDAPGATTTQLLGISSDGRYVSGYYEIDSAVIGQGFIYDRQTAQMSLIGTSGDSNQTVVKGFNDAGIAVGNERKFGTNGGMGERIAFTYDIASGQRSDVLFAGYWGASLRDIGNDGLMVGALYSDRSTARAFAGTAAAYELFDLPGATQSWAYGIGGDGSIVGTYIDADNIYHGFIATSVPEPSTWALMLGGIGFVVWRRQKSRTTA